jgi:hypothetical protein
MNPFRDIIDRWPSASALADDIGEKSVTVRAWRLAGRGIPANHFPAIVAAAQKRGIDVTLEQLHELSRPATPANDTAPEAA